MRLRLFVFALLVSVCPAQRPIDEVFSGQLLICGGGSLPEQIRSLFVNTAGGKDARIVVIPTASVSADEDGNSCLAPWQGAPHASLQVLHTRSRKKANDKDFVAPLLKATGVWISGGVQGRLAEAYRGTAVEKALHKVLQRGGIVGGTSAGAAILTKLMITGGKDEPKLGNGFDLLPGAIVDQHFTKRKRLARLVKAVARHPSTVGFGIDEGTALWLRGRSLQVVGNGAVTMCLAASKHRKARTEVWRADRSLHDLVTWRRAALVRGGQRDFAFEPDIPKVPNGTVILIGGGRLSAEIVDCFVAAAGGKDARFLVVPTAMPPRGTPGIGGMGRLLNRLGARNVDVFHATRKQDVESKANLDKIRRANAIWFDGGRQWRLVDAYAGTKALELFHGVLARGGVIAGSSAGCSIQTGFMPRGNPLGNREIGMEGYERGFAFLPGVAADQHFAQRNRFADMQKLMRRYPKILGLGVDEGTAVVANGTRFRVIGPGKVAVFAGSPEYERYGAGTVYDMVARRVVTPRRAIR